MRFKQISRDFKKARKPIKSISFDPSHFKPIILRPYQKEMVFACGFSEFMGHRAIPVNASFVDSPGYR